MSDIRWSIVIIKQETAWINIPVRIDFASQAQHLAGKTLITVFINDTP
jgi:hypothetical protein